MKVLFVCKSNVGRSQMAEAFFADMAKGHNATSAGTHVLPEWEGRPISEVTDKVSHCMTELGYEVSHKIMNKITPEMVDQVDKVVAITTKDSLPGFLKESPKLETWEDIPDAGGTDMAFHRKVRDEIRKRVEKLSKELG